MSATVTAQTVGFSALLRDVRRAATTDDGLPMIAGLMLHTAVDKADRTVLVATATDRFCAIQAHVHVEGSLPERVFVPNTQISQVLAVVRPFAGRKSAVPSEVSVDVADGRVTVRQAALDGLGDVAVSFAHDTRGDFPKVGKIFDDALSRDPHPAPYHVDPKRFVVLAQLAATRRVPLSVWSSGANRPVIAQIGDDLIGLLMPTRVGSGAERPLDVAVYPIPDLQPAAAAA